jgi:Fe-S cluster assembly protein SufD
MATTETATRFGPDAARALAERSGEPGWLVERRLAALERFDALAWPDPRSEEWRHTDLKGFALDEVTPLAEPHGAASSLDDVPAPALTAMGEVGDRDGLAVQLDADVVQVNLRRELSAKGVIFSTLAKAATEHPELVKAQLGSAGVGGSEEKFAMLNAAFSGPGAFVYVPRGVDVGSPLQSFHWLSSGGIAVFPRTVIVVEEGASLTYIDEYRCRPLGRAALAAATVEIYARPASNVSYLALQDWPQDVWHFNIQRAIIDRDATTRSLAATLGGRLSRSVVECVMDGQGASSEMLGVYFADGDQHFDHRSLQDHRAPSTTSDLYYKGALKGRSRAVYAGLVHIRKGADRSDAQQANRNLLLSDHAKADPAPFLEIEANDVRCSHGTSVGAPDPEAVFYLESRGVAPREAERLIVKAFFAEVLDRVRVPEVRATLEDAVERELQVED